MTINSFLVMMFILAFVLTLLTPNHLLNALMMLEFITLLLFFGVICPVTMSPLNTPTFLMLITLGASEASLGLAIMVSMILSYGNDKVYSLFLLPL